MNLMHVIPKNGVCMFLSGVHIDMFCGPRCCFDGTSSFLYIHIVLSVVIAGRCHCLNLAGVISNIFVNEVYHGMSWSLRCIALLFVL